MPQNTYLTGLYYGAPNSMLETRKKQLQAFLNTHLGRPHAIRASGEPELLTPKLDLEIINLGEQKNRATARAAAISQLEPQLPPVNANGLTASAQARIDILTARIAKLETRITRIEAERDARQVQYLVKYRALQAGLDTIHNWQNNNSEEVLPR